MKKLIIVILSCLLLVACNEPENKQNANDNVELKDVFVIDKDSTGIKARTYYLIFSAGPGSSTKFKLEATYDQHDFIEKGSKVNVIYNKKTYEIVEIQLVR